MIKLEVGLNDGTNLIEEVESYDSVEYEQKLNNRESMMIAIGNSVVNKGMIKVIKPIQ